jgi:hypothetical protein
MCTPFLKIVLILINVFGESHVHSIPENCFDIDQRVWREPRALHVKYHIIDLEKRGCIVTVTKS